MDRDRAGKAVIAHIESYVPISGALQHQIFGAITGVIKARRQAGAVAFHGAAAEHGDVTGMCKVDLSAVKNVLVLK